MDTMESSPSHVLQTQPFLDNFWTYPARSPVEKLHVNASHRYNRNPTTATAIAPSVQRIMVDPIDAIVASLPEGLRTCTAPRS